MSSEIVTASNVVLYCDGGFQPDTKICGWGVHGYIFTPDDPKKGTGNPKAVPTDNGYLFGERVGNKVTVQQYVDIVAGKRDARSSNEVELHALIDALSWLKENPQLTKVLIMTDSRFVVQGTNDHLPTWPANKWLTKKGEPVKYRPAWEKVSELMTGFKEAGVEIKLDWVKSHEGEPGNTAADALAWKGKVLGTNNDATVITTVKEAQGYWGIKNTAPRILQAPRWYFSTVDTEYRLEDGSCVYCIGAHGTKDKEDDLWGKRYSDNFLGVVIVKDPDPVMECLRLNAISKDSKKRGAIIIGHLDTIFSPRIYKELGDYKTTFLYSDKKHLDLLTARKEEVLVELKSTGLAFRGVEQWRSLGKVLKEVRAGDPYYRLTDITDLLYEDQGAKKPVRKLKASINQIVKYMDFNVEFNLAKEKDEPNPFIDKVRLILGEDILSRNQLAALSEDVKSVKVVTWRESDNVGRYATLIELVSGDIGIWARTEANIYFRTKL